MITHSFGNHKTKSRLLICEDKVSKSRLHSIEGSHWLDLQRTMTLLRLKR
jgi:hypothetical protein